MGPCSQNNWGHSWCQTILINGAPFCFVFHQWNWYHWFCFHGKQIHAFEKSCKVNMSVIFSCDQAALRTLISVRLSDSLSVCGHKLGCLSGFSKMNIKWSCTLCPTRAYVVDHLIWTLSIKLSGHLWVLQGFMWSICIPHRVWTKVSKLDSYGQLQSIT